MDTPRLIETGSGRTIEYRGRLLYSRSFPERRPQKIADLFGLKPHTLYLIPSPLLCYGLQQIIEKLPASSFLLLFETETALEGISRNAFSVLPASKNIMFVPVFAEQREFEHILSGIPGWPFRRVEQIILNGGYNLNREIYDALFDAADKAIRLTHQDRLTQVYFARRWMKNLFTNLSLNKGVDSFRSLTVDKPVVVAGAGESLERSFDIISQLGSDIFLIAADTALPSLCSRGIIPDAVVVLESQFINIRDFYGVPCERITLIADLSSHPPVFRLPWKKRLLFFTQFTSLSFFRDVLFPELSQYFFPAYGSVGVAAVAIAAALTGHDIYCTGLDFCYRLGKSHAKGTQFSINELSKASRTDPPGSFKPFMNRPMIDQQGKTGRIRTDLILLNYLNPLQRLAADRDSIFDLNRGGLNIGLEQRINIKLPVTKAKVTGCTGNYNQKTEKQSFNSRFFIRTEIETLKEIHSNGYEFLLKRLRDKELRVQISTRDYITAHFPDPAIPDPLTPDYIKRIMLSVEGYLTYLIHLENVQISLEIN